MDGRVLHSLDAVRADLRGGIYRLIDLKEEYRVEGPALGSSEAADAA